MKRQKTHNIQHSIEGEESLRANGSWLQDILQKYNYQVSVVLAKNKQIDQRNPKQGLEIKPQKYRQVIFDKWAKAMQWNKDSLFKKEC